MFRLVISWNAASYLRGCQILSVEIGLATPDFINACIDELPWVGVRLENRGSHLLLPSSRYQRDFIGYYTSYRQLYVNDKLFNAIWWKEYNHDMVEFGHFQAVNGNNGVMNSFITPCQKNKKGEKETSPLPPPPSKNIF